MPPRAISLASVYLASCGIAGGVLGGIGAAVFGITVGLTGTAALSGTTPAGSCIVGSGSSLSATTKA
jgi:hypothetical protein